LLKFIGAYSQGSPSVMNYLDFSVCTGYTIEMEADPEVAEWIACLVDYYAIYGAQGNPQYKCPDGCLCGEPGCLCD